MLYKSVLCSDGEISSLDSRTRAHCIDTCVCREISGWVSTDATKSDCSRMLPGAAPPSARENARTHRYDSMVYVILLYLADLKKKSTRSKYTGSSSKFLNSTIAAFDSTLVAARMSCLQSCRKPAQKTNVTHCHSSTHTWTHRQGIIRGVQVHTCLDQGALSRRSYSIRFIQITSFHPENVILLCL